MSDYTPPTIEEFIEELHQTHDQTQRELKEIDVLIKQSAAEVERLAQRNAQVTNYVNQLDIETAPREDIKEGYERLQNTQQRLFTMRGQLEKLQSDQRNLQRMAELQRDTLTILDSSGQLFAITSEQQTSPTSSEHQSDIIRVIQTEEAARQTLVRKMHDGPASSLSNFILQAEICERLFDSDPEQARTELHSLKTTAATTFSKVKDFIFDLRPMMLDDLGVVPTLRSYINSFEDKNNLPISINITGIERRIEGHMEVTIFRAVQELLNNAHAHAQATQVQIQLDMGQEQITTTVEDDGSGFNYDEALNTPQHKTMGLPTLLERIKMLNGHVDVQSQVGEGTRVEFVIPFQSL